MVMDHYHNVTKTTRKSKHHGNDHQLMNQKKKTKTPGRGVGVAQLEQIRIKAEQVEKIKAASSLLHHQYPLQNGVVQFSTTQNHHHYHHQQQQQQQLIPLTNSPPAVPQMMFSGPNHVFMDHNNVVRYQINANPGYRFDNRNEMFSSVQNYAKFCGGGGSDAACGTSCYKKTRINNMSNSNNNNHLNTSNQFRYGLNNNNVIEKVDYTGKNLGFSPQVKEVMPGYRRVRYGMAEYEFFPGKGASEMTSSWCVSGGGTERGGGGMIGSHGGEGSSCVTAVTSTTNEEGSVCCSVDLSLKL